MGSVVSGLLFHYFVTPETETDNNMLTLRSFVD